jgi:hypothetical protein
VASLARALESNVPGGKKVALTNACETSQWTSGVPSKP